jgi:hypothetical protein
LALVPPDHYSAHAPASAIPSPRSQRQEVDA